MQTPEHLKTEAGEESFNPDGLAQRSIKLLKDTFPDIEVRLMLCICLHCFFLPISQSPHPSIRSFADKLSLVYTADKLYCPRQGLCHCHCCPARHMWALQCLCTQQMITTLGCLQIPCWSATACSALGTYVYPQIRAFNAQHPQ